MGTNGEIIKAVAFGNITLTLTQERVDVLKNCSYWNAVLTRYTTSNIASDEQKKGSIVVNGKTVWNESVTIGGSGTKTLATVSDIEIPHNDDGSKAFSFSFSQAIDITWAGVQIKTVSGSGTITANKISRASTINTVSGNTIGSEITISITRHNDNFKHELLYTFGSLKNQLIQKDIDTSHKFILPLSICSQIPDATSGKITLILRTYNGTSKVGNDTTKVIDINIPESVEPVIESIEISEAIDEIAGVFDAYIKDKSVLNVKINAQGAYGSAVKYYNASFLGVNYTGQTFQSNLITKSGELEITAKVTDSRGRTATFTKKVNVLDYFPPQASYLKVNRCSQDGTLNAKGGYARIEFSFAIAQLNNKNIKDVKIQWLNGEQWETLNTYKDIYSATNEVYISSVEFNEDNAFMIRILCNDYFSSGENEKRLKATKSIFKFNKNKKGLGIFTASTKDGVQIGSQIYDMFDKCISNGLAVYTENAEENIDADITTDTLILTDNHTPTEELYYIMTFFHADKAPTSNRSQIAIPYNHISGIFYRYFISEKWSAWLK